MIQTDSGIYLPYNNIQAENSILAFVNILIEIRVNKKIAKYSKNEKLLRRIPGYKVDIGVGLHLGSAMEGPIGSYFKLDASYISENVNFSMNLESKTKCTELQSFLAKMYIVY